MIVLRATKTKLVVLRREYVSTGSSKVYDVEFRFSPDWDGLQKIVYFREGENEPADPILLPLDNHCQIPSEVLYCPGKMLYIGVMGLASDVLIDDVLGGSETTDDGEEPSPEDPPVDPCPPEPPDPIVLPTMWCAYDIIRRGVQSSTPGFDAAILEMGKIRDESVDAKNTSCACAEEAKEAATDAVEATTHPPIISDHGTWMIWDPNAPADGTRSSAMAKGKYVDTGLPARGETGPQGEPGTPGQNGSPGPSAYEVAVENGFTGTETEWLDSLKNGPPGPVGPPGQDGKDGADGAPGEKGPQGEIGPIGPKGDKGDIGPAGPAGKDGAPGAKGDPGSIGPPGPPGATGATGAVGPKGDPGPKGDKGDKGDKGNTGDRGPQGLQGVPGDAGPQGLRGDKGDPGKTPFIGENGNWWIDGTDLNVPATGDSSWVSYLKYPGLAIAPMSPPDVKMIVLTSLTCPVPPLESAGIVIVDNTPVESVMAIDDASAPRGVYICTATFKGENANNSAYYNALLTSASYIGAQESTEGSDVFTVRVPIGTITIWSGEADNIPDGWALCNGKNGTPDLRDRFVLGAGTTYDVGTTGGEATHTLLPEELASHKHDEEAVSGSSGNVSGVLYTTEAQIRVQNVYTSVFGQNSPHNNMPPYYALCYIMKVSPDPAVDGVTQAELTAALATKQDVFEVGSTLELTANARTAGGRLEVKTPVQSILTQSEFDALSETQQNKGLYVIAENKTTRDVVEGFEWWSPHMTSNVTPAPYSVAASSEIFVSAEGEPRYACRAFDGNLDTYWSNDSSGGDPLSKAFITFSFGNLTVIRGVRIQVYDSSFALTKFTLSGQVALSGSFTQILQITSSTTPMADGWYEYIFDAPVAVYSVKFTNMMNEEGWTAATSEIEFLVEKKETPGGSMKLVLNGESVEFGTGQNGIPTVPLTQAEYDALTDDEKNAEKLYLITDAAASGSDSGGSSENVYSTEETRIGTWIDGKPLYRMVLTGEVTHTTGTYISIYDNFFTEKNLIFAKGHVMFIGASGGSASSFALLPNYPHPNVLYTGDNAMVTLSYSSAENHLYLSYKTQWAFSYVISVEYTKTTDTATRRLT